MTLMEERLRACGAALEFPGEATLADDVLASIRADVGGGRRRSRILLAAAAVVLLAAVAVVAMPGSRQSLARWLGLARLEVRVVGALPTATDGGLGPTFTLEGAGTTVGVTPYVAPALGDPVSVHAPGGRYVAARYDDAGTEVLVTTLPGTLFHKQVVAGSQVRPVEVDGVDAIWVTGEPHVLAYEDDLGRVEVSRTAGNTLAWQQGDVVVRVEGDLSLRRALELASGVRRADGQEG